MNRNWKKVGVFTATLLVLVLVLANVEVASAHHWEHWHFDKSTLGVLIENNYQTEADSARLDWDAYTDLSLPRVFKHKDADISVWGKNFGNTGWVGLASIEKRAQDWASHCGGSVEKCKIVHAHARYNSHYGGTGGVGYDSHIRGVFCQEIGHTFGLDHHPKFMNYSVGGCMCKGYFECSGDPSSFNNTTSYHDWTDINDWY